MAEMNGTHTLLTETDVSKQLRVSLAALRKWRVLNRGPQFVKMGPLVRYRQTDIDSWLGSLPVGGGPCHESFGNGPQAFLGSGQSAGTTGGRLKQSAGSR
jgi:predicted DNA-binding transcriptional regulator AlpA